MPSVHGPRHDAAQFNRLRPTTPLQGRVQLDPKTGRKAALPLRFGTETQQAPDAIDRFFDGGCWKAGIKGAWYNTMKLSKFGKDLLVSGLITLATCWLPGTQLVFIPLWILGRVCWDVVNGFTDAFSQHQPASEAESG